MDSIEQHLISQNPHWTGAQNDTGIPRPAYLQKIQRILIGTKEILILSGIRRSGKTTLIRQTIARLIETKTAEPTDILLLSCDTAELHQTARPLETAIEAYQKLTGKTNGYWLFLDEIQEIPDFPRTLKNLYDSGRCRIIISGSTSHPLTSQTGIYLTGRYIPLQVYPLSFKEYLTFNGITLPENRLQLLAGKYQFISSLKKYLHDGGFPALTTIKNPATRTDYLKAYYDGIVYRDIINSHDVRNQKIMTEMLRYLITNIAVPQTYRGIAKLFGTEPATIQDYISYAEDGYLLFQITRFSYSYKKQIAAPKKMYAADTGLRGAVGFVFSADTGRLMENVVCLELMRRGYKPGYWKETNEIDFAVQTAEGLLLINVCNTSEIPERELAGFAEFTRYNPELPATKLLLTEDLEQELPDGVRAKPVWQWLLESET